MVKLAKSVLARKIKTHYHYPEDGDLLVDLVEKCGQNARLYIEYDYSDCTIRIVWDELETDEEYEARLESERQYKIAESARKRNKKLAVETQERELYEKLKVKYG